MAAKKLSIDSIDLANKRVLIRVDFDIPLKDGKITSNRRLVAALNTVRYAFYNDAKVVILMSHMGRPNGQFNAKYSLKPVAEELKDLVNTDFMFLPDCVDLNVEIACADAKEGTLVLLENLRFHIEEEGKGINCFGMKLKADPTRIIEFRENLKTLADVYVNDSFATSHQSHSSMLGEGFDQRVAGFLLKKELEYFEQVFANPEKPILVILGGADFVDKIHLIDDLLDKVDEIIIGGGMAYTFLGKNHGMQIGDSLYDEDAAEIVDDLLAKAKNNGVKIHLPVDFVTAEKFEEDAKVGKADLKSGIEAGWMGLDVGPRTIEAFKAPIRRAKMVVWSGPVGVFEWDNFAKGTETIMNEVVAATQRGAVTIIAGGDTANCVSKWEAEEKVSHVSTGSACLQLLVGKELPGVAALSDV